MADLPGGGLAPQIAVVELDGGSHALVVVVHHGAEHRGLLQPGHLLHLGQVLVAQAGAVEPGTEQLGRLVGGLILGDHLSASAGVASEGEAGEGAVPEQNMEGGQGGCRGQEADGVAAGISHPTGLSDDALWVLVQLREAIDPAGGGTVGGGGINDPGVSVLNELQRLHCGGIGQAEKHQVGRVEVFFPLRRVLAPGLADAQQFEIGPPGEPLPELKASGTLPAVDKDLRLIHVCVSPRIP